MTNTDKRQNQNDCGSFCICNVIIQCKPRKFHATFGENDLIIRPMHVLCLPNNKTEISVKKFI